MIERALEGWQGIEAAVDSATHAVLATSGEAWVYPLVFAIVAADALLIAVPSETVVVSIGAFAVSVGQPDPAALIVAASLGAVVGDSGTYWVARRVDLRRRSWCRARALQHAFARAEAALDRRAIPVLLTARFVPFGRVVVNVVAGATGLPYGRFLLLTAAAGAAWASYSILLGAAFGHLLGGSTLLAVLVSVLAALILGMIVDLAVRRVASWNGSRRR